jgi:hypothetical protein
LIFQALEEALDLIAFRVEHQVMFDLDAAV